MPRPGDGARSSFKATAAERQAGLVGVEFPGMEVEHRHGGPAGVAHLPEGVVAALFAALTMPLAERRCAEVPGRRPQTPPEHAAARGPQARVALW